MTATPGDPLLDALAPVRAALVRAAREDADRVLSTAGRNAERTLAEVEEQARLIRARAVADGAADAATALATERVQARRRGRQLVLAARRTAYQALREQGRAAVAAIAAQPDYPVLRRSLADAVRQHLGPSALVQDAAGGGVIGRLGPRSVDLSLAGFADRATDALAAELDEQ